MKKKILHVKAGEPVAASLTRARDTMQALRSGKRSEPYFGVGFESMGQMLATFTPRRLDLLATLREHGPTTIAALARTLGRDYKNVHGDINALFEWLAVDRDEQGRVFVPWDEVDIRLPLTKQAA